MPAFFPSVNESRTSMTTATDDDSPAALDPRLQAHIGRKLREYYNEITAQPVPDRFKALLDQLESRENRIAVPRAAAEPEERETNDSSTELGR